MGQAQGVTTETGQLTAVLVHRPGPELARLTPRHAARLQLRTLPWLARARQEHDVLCEQLRSAGAEVVYFTDLLQDALDYAPARHEAIGLAVTDARLGEELRGQLRAHLEDLDPGQLAQALIAGLAPGELAAGHGVVFALLDRHDFVLDPLPNLMFTRDASFWVGAAAGLATLPARRRREAGLAGVVYRHHPRFGQAGWLYPPGPEQLAGGDVLLLAPGAVAIGVGPHTTAAGAERLAGALFAAGLASVVLAVPLRRAAHLDTLCSLVGPDTVLMAPAAAYTLTAHTITPGQGGLRVSRAQPFLQAAAEAMGTEALRVIDSAAHPPGRPPGRWDDGGNVLALAPGLVVSHERNAAVNARLEEAGIEVLRVPGSELGSVRGGPRCMTCALRRESVPVAAGSLPGQRQPGQLSNGAGEPARRLDRPAAVPASREASYSGAIRAVRGDGGLSGRGAPQPGRPGWPDDSDSGPDTMPWPAVSAAEAGPVTARRGHRWTSRRHP